MRVARIAAVCVLALAPMAVAADEPAPPAQPVVMMASATVCDGAVTLHIRTTQFAPATREVVSQVPVVQARYVKGRVIERPGVVEERHLTQVLRPVPGAVMDVPVDGVGVIVTDMKGKPVAPARLALLLKKERAVLVSMTGPVDPFFLQTTRNDALLVQMAPARIAEPAAPQQELLPPARLAPTGPKPLPPVPGEPPVAPTKPGY